MTERLPQQSAGREQPLELAGEETRHVRMVSFTVGDELFLIDIMAVKQIVPYGGTSPIPNAPAHVEGIIVLRDEVIPVIDLRLRMNAARTSAAGDSLIVIATSVVGSLGLKVDAVRRIVNVEVESILPPPPLLSARDGLFVGVVQQTDSLYLVIDLDRISAGLESVIALAS